MTDSSDPAPFSRRSDPSREPPTIDLKATSVDEGVRPPPPASPDEGAPEATAEPSGQTRDEAATGAAGIGASDPVAPSDASARPVPGFGALSGAGLLGGLVGAGLVLAVQTWRAGPTPPDPRVAQLENRVEVLARGDAVRQAEERIATLRDQQGALERQLQETQRLAQQAAGRADEAMNRPVPAPAPAAPQNTEALTDLSNRLGALETQVRDGLQAASSAAQATAGQVQALERRAAEQDQRIAALGRQVAESGSEATKAATRVVLADRLGNALREGAPYQDVMEALRRFDGSTAALTSLEPFAASGAPTAAALARSFEPVGDRIIRETRSGSEDWSDRLIRMADRIVTIRPVDQPGQTSVPGLVARIKDALDRGALADAVAAWDALPEPARRLSADWGTQLQERAAAETAARQVAADALAALNQPSR